MRSFELKNIRCFRSPGGVRLAPLTLLVGENSTGKSTFLAALRLAWDACFGDKPLDFNEEPFLLGAYDQIAHYRGGKGGRANELRLAMSVGMPGMADVKIDTTFGRHRSQPSITKQTFATDNVSLTVTTANTGTKRRLQIRMDDHSTSFDLDEPAFRMSRAEGRLVEWENLLWTLSKGELKLGPNQEDSRAKFEELWQRFFHTRDSYDTRPFALAPVRTKPLRTYDPISETPTPEGTHVPILMEQAYFRDKEKWQEVKEFLEGFGRASGLFNKIQIRPLGKSESDPFQVRLTIAGPPTNLIDVGYGISQILPLVVSTLLKPTSRIFLFQQPEVHLHPRAQAELSTLFTNLVTQGKVQLIVETHSDHLLDRVRTDVRKGVWKPEDVTILFFERKHLDVKIHQITIDGDGNLLDAPPSYRRFFLDEDQRILGL